MAQKKLLSILVWGLYFYKALLSATTSLASTPQEIVWNDLSSQNNTEPTAILRIFVSKSMPVSLIREYAKEAKKYNGILVFKGLPNGSFVAMQELVADIGLDDMVMQIDEEAFDKHEISSVPTVSLSIGEDCWALQSCKQHYSKLNGNIGIKFALEKFQEDPLLAQYAASLLEAK